MCHCVPQILQCFFVRCRVQKLDVRPTLQHEDLYAQAVNSCICANHLRGLHIYPIRFCSLSQTLFGAQHQIWCLFEALARLCSHVSSFTEPPHISLVFISSCCGCLTLPFSTDQRDIFKLRVLRFSTAALMEYNCLAKRTTFSGWLF